MCCAGGNFDYRDMKPKMDVPSPEPGFLEQENNINKNARIRNLAAFWLLGLCNNYGFVVMLSAAYDILETNNTVPTSEVELPVMANLTNATVSGRFQCNPLSAGAVLLAVDLPSVIIDLSAPWFADYIPYDIRIATCVVSVASSFLVVGFANAQKVALNLMGVVFAGVSTGLGEFTYVSLMSFYDKNTVSTWSSGTGASGLVSSLSYAGLTEILTPRETLLVMLIVPCVMIVSYWGILVRVPIFRPTRNEDSTEEEKQQLIERKPTEGANHETPSERHLTLEERLRHLKHLMKYMIPLCLVYVAQCFINQGLLELIFFRGIWMKHEAQYRWFQVLYRLGMFFSRSSVNMVRIRRLWIFPLLQWCVVVLIFTEAYFAYMPNIFIVFAIVLFEGFVGGLAYVNTFYQIRENECPKYKEFAMGTTLLSTAIGTSLAGVIAMPVHSTLCQL